MEFQLISDIHVDHHADNGAEFCRNLPVLCDTLIIAGDICNGHSLLYQTLSSFAKKFKNVLMVDGNHHLYGCLRSDLHNTMRKITQHFPNVHYLNCSSVAVEGVTIHGCTLWFKEDPLAFPFKENMNDFTQIRNFEPWVYSENKKHVKYLQDNVKEGDVVVTHHLPSYACVDRDYRGDNLNRFYVCEIESMFRENKPAVAVHGHSHASVALEIYDTRVYCNPLGYSSELNPNFNDNLVIKV